MLKPTLFARAGTLGDLIVTLPLLAQLQAAGPVHVALRRAFRPLVPLLGPIARVWDIDGLEAAWMFGGADPVGYARAVVFSPTVEAGLRQAGVPEIERITAPPPYGIPRLSLPDLPPLSPRPVVISPGAGGPDRRWPMERWRGVAAALGDRPVIWLAGPAEVSEPGWPAGTITLGLAETAALAARCAAWLGPDAGPTHLAAAAGARVGVVFGPTDPAIWAPPGSAVFGWDTEAAEIAAWVG